MDTKSHLFEIMQFYFLHSILLFFILIKSAETKFSQKIEEYLVFSYTVTYFSQKILRLLVCSVVLLPALKPACF